MKIINNIKQWRAARWFAVANIIMFVLFWIAVGFSESLRFLCYALLLMLVDAEQGAKEFWHKQALEATDRSLSSHARAVQEHRRVGELEAITMEQAKKIDALEAKLKSTKNRHKRRDDDVYINIQVLENRLRGLEANVSDLEANKQQLTNTIAVLRYREKQLEDELSAVRRSALVAKDLAGQEKEKAYRLELEVKRLRMIVRGKSPQSPSESH